MRRRVPHEYTLVREQLASVEELMAQVVRRAGVCPVFHRSLFSPRSKRLRPSLLLLAAHFGRHGSTALVPAAAGVELLHQATLYHDDIVDEADVRRGQPTVQRRCGSIVASLAGSQLLFATAEMFAGLPASLRRAVGRAGDALCRGQLAELELVGGGETGVRVRQRIMRDKTAHLFALAARLGAELGGASEWVVHRLAGFGLRLGLVFQLADDLSDVVASPRELGRRAGEDVLHGVYTLPVLYALDGRGTSSDELRACLAELQRCPAQALIDRALHLVAEADGVDRGLATLADWVALARSDLAELAGEAPPVVLDAIEGLVALSLKGLGRTGRRIRAQRSRALPRSAADVIGKKIARGAHQCGVSLTEVIHV